MEEWGKKLHPTFQPSNLPMPLYLIISQFSTASTENFRLTLFVNGAILIQQ